jgi:hypothetical protein
MNLGQLSFYFGKAQKRIIKEKSPEKWTYDYIGKIFACYLFKGRLTWKEILQKIEDLRFLQNKHKRVLGESRQISNKKDYFTELSKIFMLHHSMEPCNEFFFLNNQAENDKNKIALYKDFCESEIKKIQNQNGISPDKKNKLIFYYTNEIKKYQHTEEQIEIFLRKDIYGYTFKIKPIMWVPPYGIVQPPIDEQTTLVYKKFSKKTIPEVHDILQKCKENPDNLYDFAKEYIQRESILQEANNIIAQNGLLSEIQLSLKKTISYYKKDPYIFCILAISQIEGLFYLYCKDMGYSDKQLLASSISDKVSLLRAKNKKILFSLDETYYTIYFPIFRNRMMHGIKINDDWEKKSFLILIDFFEALSTSQSKYLHFNILKKLLDDLNVEFSFEKMTALYALWDYFPPCMIKLRDSIAIKHRQSLKKEIKEQVKSHNTEWISYFRKFAESLTKPSEKNLKIEIFKNITTQQNIDKWSFVDEILKK